MPIAFSTLACPDWTWTAIVSRGTDYGYDGVEVRLVGGEIDLRKVSDFAPSRLAATRADLDRRQFSVCGLASSVRFDHDDAHETRRQVEIGAEYLALAEALGAPSIRVFGDVLPTESSDRRAAIYRQIVGGLRELGDHAARRGLLVLVETHGDFSDSRLLAELLAAVDHPAVGTLWDTHHPWRFFDETFEDTWARLSARCPHTHWKDSVTRPHTPDEPASAAAQQARSLMSGHRHADYVLFGGGEFPAESCARVLVAGGFTGWHSLEWERAWHPEIEAPEIALPLFPTKLRRILATCQSL